MKDLISIIVPVYNADKYLRACVDSIIRQTYNNLEIILVDDGSLDNSAAICEEYAVKDSRVFVINQSNGGAAAARNAGLDQAKGDYIMFADADDILEPIMCEVLVEQLLKYGADISQCGATYTDICQYDESSIQALNISTEVLSWREAIIDLLDSGTKFNSGLWNKLYKRELFDQIRFSKVRGEDFVLLYQMLRKKKPQIVRNTVPLYHYIKRNASVTTGPLNVMNLQFIEMLHQMEAQERDPELLMHWKIQKAVSARNVIIRQIVSGSFPESYDGLRNDMIGAKFIIFKKKYRYIEKSLKKHILLILVAPRMYNVYIKKAVNKAI